MHSINNRKIVSMDSKVLRKANIKKKKEYLFSEAVILVNNSFKYLKDAKRVCGKCEWKDKCLWYQSREWIINKKKIILISLVLIKNYINKSNINKNNINKINFSIKNIIAITWSWIKPIHLNITSIKVKLL